LQKNYHYIFEFVKVMPKVLLVPFSQTQSIIERYLLHFYFTFWWPPWNELTTKTRLWVHWASSHASHGEL